MDQKQIGEFILLLRKEQQMTQEDLAEKLNVSYKSVSRWENGRNLPDVSLMLELCSLFHISMDELLSGTRLSEEEQTAKTKENVFTIVITKGSLEMMSIWTEILIVCGTVIAMTFPMLFFQTVLQKMVVCLIGWFVWGYGLFLRMKLKKIADKI